jgi:iron(III) transport system substrate-binding protein
MQSRSARYLLLALLPFTLACPLNRGARAADAPQVNVYSYRQPYLLSPLLKKFTEETGIKINVILAEKDLIERIAAEGRNSPADLLFTVGVGNLMQAKGGRRPSGSLANPGARERSGAEGMDELRLHPLPQRQ